MTNSQSSHRHVVNYVARYNGDHRSTVVEGVAQAVYGDDTRRADAAVTAAQNANVVNVDQRGRVWSR